MPTSIEGALPTPARVPGYPSLAGFLTSDRDHYTAIHRRFGYPSTLDLLIYESELSELEKELCALDRAGFLKKEDDNGIRDFKTFFSQAEVPGSDASKRWQHMLKIRSVMKEYREAVQFEHLMLSRPTPSNQEHEALFNTFWNRNESETYPILGGASTTLYDNRDDLMSLRPTAQREDWLSRLLQTRLGLLFQDKQNPCHPNARTDSLIYISHAKIDTFVTIVTVVFAAAFLYGSIWSLFYVRAPATTLGLLTMWTVLFAVVVASITNARRSEIFSACAAYVAVLVIFVSGNVGNGSP